MSFLGDIKDKVTGGFESIFGGKSARETLFGEAGTPERIEELKRDQDILNTQRQARGIQRSALSNLMGGASPSSLASQTIQAQERAARASTGDASRALSSQLARRGLGSSSIGLGQLTGLRQREAQRIGDIRSQQPMLQEQLRAKRLQQLFAGSGSVLGTPGLGKQYVKYGATAGTSGLAPLIFGAAGAAAGGAGGGGAQGAQAGGQTGMGMGTMLSGAFQ